MDTRAELSESSASLNSRNTAATVRHDPLSKLSPSSSSSTSTASLSKSDPSLESVMSADVLNEFQHRIIALEKRVNDGSQAVKGTFHSTDVKLRELKDQMNVYLELQPIDEFRDWKKKIEDRLRAIESQLSVIVADTASPSSLTSNAKTSVSTHSLVSKLLRKIGDLEIRFDQYEHASIKNEAKAQDILTECQKSVREIKALVQKESLLTFAQQKSAFKKVSRNKDLQPEKISETNDFEIAAPAPHVVATSIPVRAVIKQRISYEKTRQEKVLQTREGSAIEQDTSDVITKSSIESTLSIVKENALSDQSIPFNSPPSALENEIKFQHDENTAHDHDPLSDLLNDIIAIPPADESNNTFRIPVTLFVDATLREARCHKCNSIVDRFRKWFCAAHGYFCDVCVLHSRDGSKNKWECDACPICHIDIQSMENESISIDEQIENTVMRCEYFRLGCVCAFKVKDRRSHRRECAINVLGFHLPELSQQNLHSYDLHSLGLLFLLFPGYHIPEVERQYYIHDRFQYLVNKDLLSGSNMSHDEIFRSTLDVTSRVWTAAINVIPDIQDRSACLGHDISSTKALEIASYHAFEQLLVSKSYADSFMKLLPPELRQDDYIQCFKTFVSQQDPFVVEKELSVRFSIVDSSDYIRPQRENGNSKSTFPNVLLCDVYYQDTPIGYAVGNSEIQARSKAFEEILRSLWHARLLHIMYQSSIIGPAFGNWLKRVRDFDPQLYLNMDQKP